MIDLIYQNILYLIGKIMIKEYKTPASPDNIYVVEDFMDKEDVKEIHLSLIHI